MKLLMQGHDLDRAFYADPGIKASRVNVMALTLLRKRNQTLSNTSIYSTLSPGRERLIAKAKLSEDDHITPHSAGKAWVFPMKSIWGAKLHRREAVFSHGVSNFHHQTEVTEVEFPCAQAFRNIKYGRTSSPCFQRSKNGIICLSNLPSASHLAFQWEMETSTTYSSSHSNLSNIH
ncbi:hypothetical protein BDV23DRAFT_148120 [Aspergillus alliaceus]|uniref:Uncharacterized protein n=1 Tax=Petromyces alliaceus TaxID=209559 RepID=A0A5N7CKJ4_PETAA|nr:hypothetical protein BDV23DRAFT_148120 [Aspergillus alliaceus]